MGVQYRHQEFQFPMWYAAYRGRESEHQVLNGSLIFVSFTRTPILFGSKFQYSRKRRQDEEGKQSNKAAIRDLVLTFCHTVRRIQQRKLKLLMPVYQKATPQTQGACLCQPISLSVAAMLCASAVVVERTRPRAIPLAMIAMIMNSWVSYSWVAPSRNEKK